MLGKACPQHAVSERVREWGAPPSRGHLLFPCSQTSFQVMLTVNRFSRYIHLVVGQRIGTKLRSPGLVASAFTHWAILSTQDSSILYQNKQIKLGWLPKKTPGKQRSETQEVSDRCVRGLRVLKDTAFERQRAFLLGSQDTMSWLSTDVTVYKEDLHQAPQGPLPVEIYAWQYVPFSETSGWGWGPPGSRGHQIQTPKKSCCKRWKWCSREPSDHLYTE